MRPLILAIILLSLTGPASTQTPKPFTADAIFQLEFADDPRISPDGTRIVYVRTSNDIQSDRARRSLWIVNSDGSDHRPLITGPGDYTSPRWSPDGTRLAYIEIGEGERQAHIVGLKNGETETLTDAALSPSDLAWSPDGQFVAFTAPVGVDPPKLGNIPAPPDGAQWAPAMEVIDKTLYRFDGKGYLKPEFTQIFVAPTDGGAARQLTHDPLNHTGPLGLTPDGKSLLFAANRDADRDYQLVDEDVFALTVATSKLTQITDLQGGETQPQMSPDGRYLAFIHGDHRSRPVWPQILTVLDRRTGETRSLTSQLDRRVRDFTWAADSQSLTFRYNDGGEGHLASVSLDGEITALIDNIGGTVIGRPYIGGAFSLARTGAIAFTHGRPDRPAELAVWHQGRSATLTALNDDLLADRALGSVESFTYPSPYDGRSIQAWMITPPDFDPGRKYPLVLEIHGGPHLAYGPYFSAELQRYAAEGYVVVYNNYRGSTSYGQDFAAMMIDKYVSEEDYADHMGSVDAVIARGFIDEDNLFLTGGSAGGIASAYIIGLTDRFRAAAVIKPVINWISKSLMGDVYPYQLKHQFPGPPWEHLEHYWKRSPLSLVGNVTTPTLLMAAEEDFRTPIAETEQFYQALKWRGVDSVLIRIPEASHSFEGRPSRLVAKTEHILAWFARYKSTASDTAAIPAPSAAQ